MPTNIPKRIGSTFFLYFFKCKNTSKKRHCYTEISHWYYYSISDADDAPSGLYWVVQNKSKDNAGEGNKPAYKTNDSKAVCFVRTIQWLFSLVDFSYRAFECYCRDTFIDSVYPTVTDNHIIHGICIAHMSIEPNNALT